MTTEAITRHVCWGCAATFDRPRGAGRPPRWCSDACRNHDRSLRRQEAREDERAKAARAYRAHREARLIERYGPEGAAALMRGPGGTKAGVDYR